LQWISNLVLAGALVLAPAALQAQELPKCSIRIVVSGAAGGTPDLIARTEADMFAAALGTSAVVENKVGGLGAITSVNAVKASEPNGCTMLAANASLFSIMPTLYKKPPFDPLNDFVPVSILATSANLLVVNADVPAKTLNELIALLKANPDKYVFGSGGIGTPMHLYAELVRAQTGQKITHVPYKGSPPAIMDVVAGRAQFIFDQIPSLLAQIQAGKLRPIAVASPQRSQLLPDVPTLKEAGLVGADAVSWFGLMAPKGTPAHVREAYAEILRKGIKDAKVIARLKALGAEPFGTTSAEMADYLDRQRKAWEPLVKASGVVID
jgi:tripartite-type tricarboxylate transporter receptor subunit TctC